MARSAAAEITGDLSAGDTKLVVLAGRTAIKEMHQTEHRMVLDKKAREVEKQRRVDRANVTALSADHFTRIEGPDWADQLLAAGRAGKSSRRKDST